MALQGGSSLPGNDPDRSILLIQSMCKLLPRSDERCSLLMRLQHQCIPLLKYAWQTFGSECSALRCQQHEGRLFLVSSHTGNICSREHWWIKGAA